MKLYAMLVAMLLGFALAGCEQPAEQDEPEQVDPETEATMESAPETEPVETPPPEARDMETTTQEAGEAEETGEGEETEGEEPPPGNT